MTTTINLKRSDCQILTSRIFVKILYKINYCNKKGNQKFLSIDLLKQEIQKDKRREEARGREEEYGSHSALVKTSTSPQKHWEYL